MNTKQKAQQINEQLKNERQAPTMQELESLFSADSIGEALSNMRDVVLNFVVSIGYYAVITTLGFWATFAIAALVTNAFWCTVILIFGFACSMALAIVSSDFLAKPTITGAKWAYNGIASLCGSAKDKIVAMTSKKNDDATVVVH